LRKTGFLTGARTGEQQGIALLEALAAEVTLERIGHLAPEEQDALTREISEQMLHLAAEQVVRLAREAQAQGNIEALASQLEAQAEALAEGETEGSPARQIAQFLWAVAALLRGQEPPPYRKLSPSTGMS